MANQVKVKLPDGAVREYGYGTTIEQIAGSISPGLRKLAVAGTINGEMVDLNRSIEQDCDIAIITLDSKEGLKVYRHSTAHVMAQALKRIYGEKSVKLGIGPVIEDGFYYDIDIEKPLSSEDLAAIEQVMENIIAENLPIVRREVDRVEAIRIFERQEEPPSWSLFMICRKPLSSQFMIKVNFTIYVVDPTSRLQAVFRHSSC